MRLGNLLTLNTAIALAFALGFLLMPGSLLSLYGISPVPNTMFLARIFGAEILGVGLLSWFGRNVSDHDLQRGISIALLAMHAVGAVILTKATLDGVLGAAGWTAVALYFFLAVGFGYFSFNRTGSA